MLRSYQGWNLQSNQNNQTNHLINNSFELRWKSTIVTSQDDDSQVPCVRIIKNIYRFGFKNIYRFGFGTELECLRLSYA